MELYEAMSTLRAVRRLRPDPIPDAVLQRVLTAATWAPTGGNRQPWRIVAVKDRGEETGARRPVSPALGSLHRQLSQTHGVDAGARTAQRRRARSTPAITSRRHMHEVPVIAVFCFNPAMMTITDSDRPEPSVVGGGSVYPAVQNLLLACRNEGLGCVLTTLLCLEEAKVAH